MSIAPRLDARLPVLLCGFLLTLGCATTAPSTSSGRDAGPPPAPFSHELLDRVLQRFVDPEGRVDYEALAADRGDLDRYAALLAETSPDSHPGRFRDDASRLAYWIDAYNASVLVKVLEHYPIDSVTDVPRPLYAFFLPRLSGFFLFQPLRLGGDDTNLFALENLLIRRRFAEPRIHFALNCASSSCPKLPQRAFRAATLEEDLEREARRFVAEERNVRIDPEARVVELSRIFDWFEGDFVSHVERSRPEVEPSLRAYLEPLLAPEKARALAACADCEVRFRSYDWALNDRDLVR